MTEDEDRELTAAEVEARRIRSFIEHAKTISWVGDRRPDISKADPYLDPEYDEVDTIKPKV